MTEKNQEQQRKEILLSRLDEIAKMYREEYARVYTPWQLSGAELKDDTIVIRYFLGRYLYAENVKHDNIPAEEFFSANWKNLCASRIHSSVSAYEDKRKRSIGEDFPLIHLPGMEWRRE